MLKRNLIANYLGQGWTALMGLAFVPLYIQYLGIEAYGLIGLFAVLQAWLALLDMGLTPRRFQVRALASRGQGAAGRRSRGSALHRMPAAHEPAMTDPTRREEYDFHL